MFIFVHNNFEMRPAWLHNQKQDKLALVCLQRLSNFFGPIVRVYCLLIYSLSVKKKYTKSPQDGRHLSLNHFVRYGHNGRRLNVFDKKCSVKSSNRTLFIEHIFLYRTQCIKERLTLRFQIFHRYDQFTSM